MNTAKGLVLLLVAALLIAGEASLVRERLEILAWPTIVGTVTGHDVVTEKRRGRGRTRTTTIRFAEVAYRLPSTEGREMPVLHTTLPGGHAAPVGAEVLLKASPDHPDDAVEYSLPAVWIIPAGAGLAGGAVLFMLIQLGWPTVPLVTRARNVKPFSPRVQIIAQSGLVIAILACIVYRPLLLILVGGLFVLLTLALLAGSLWSALLRLQPAAADAPAVRRPGAVGLLVDLLEQATLAVIATGFLAASLLGVFKGSDEVLGAHAWWSGPVNLVRTALWLPADRDRALCDAAFAGNIAGARWLAGHGARPEAVCAGPDPTITPAFLIDAPEFPRGESVLGDLLIQAVMDNRLIDARSFLEQGASAKIRVGDEPLLLYAAWNKLDPFVEVLLEHGADPNARVDDGNVMSAMASLDQPAKARAYLRQMVAHGGDLERPLADGRPMLLSFCRHPAKIDNEFFDVLLDLGARPDVADVDGRTCIDHLNGSREFDAIASVLRHGGHSGRLARGTPITASSDAGRVAAALVVAMREQKPKQWSPSAAELAIPDTAISNVADSLPRDKTRISGFQLGDRASALVCDAELASQCVALELRRDAGAAKGWKVISLWESPP